MTPESSVYRRVEGTGAAQIFGREGNPMGAFYRRKGDIERKKAIAAEQAKLDKEKRDKKMWDMINVDPEKAFQPFNQQVIDAADKHRARIVDYFEKGGNPEDPTFQRMAKKGWNEVNDLATRANYIKNTIDETQKVIKENPYLQQEYYFPKIWDMYMDEKGNGKPLDQVDPVSIQNIYTADPMGFNEKKYMDDYMKGLNENMTSYVQQTATNNGILTEDIETKWKGNLYTPDESSPLGVKTDAEGKPLLNVTPELVNSFLNSDNAKRYYEAIAGQEGKDLRSIVTDRFSVNSGGLKRDVKPSFSRDANWYYDYMNSNGSGIDPKKVPIATRRIENITSLINAFTTGDKATPQAEAALGYIANNTKFGDGHVVGAKLVKGTNSPGTTEIMPGVVVTNNPNDRLVLQVKYSDRGLPKVQEVNLNDPSAFASLNSLYETAESEGGNSFGVDQLFALKKIDPSKIYKGRENLVADNEASKQAEDALMNTIVNSPEGNEIPEVVGRYADGKKITSARKIISEPGWSPGIWGKPWGQKEAIEIGVQGEDGNVSYRKVNDEELRQIIRGEGAPQKKGKLKDSYEVNGQKMTVAALKKLGYTDEQILEAQQLGTIK
jgi:hypothetical protein